MIDIYQVLREKELAIARVREEIEALRFVIALLAEDGDDLPDRTQPASQEDSEWPRESFLPASGTNPRR